MFRHIFRVNGRVIFDLSRALLSLVLCPDPTLVRGWGLGMRLFNTLNMFGGRHKGKY